MILSRWDVKRLIKALDLAHETASYRAGIKDWPKTMRAKAASDAAHYSVLKRDLELALAHWNKNGRHEI